MPAAVGTDVVEWRGGLATAKLLSIHGRHAPNWEYAPRSRSTRMDAAWTCWTGPELIFRSRALYALFMLEIDSDRVWEG